jgi:tetratricopeptide (TPR) repeat protein
MYFIKQKILAKLEKLPENALEQILEFITDLELGDCSKSSLSQVTDSQSLLLNLKDANAYYQHGTVCLQREEYQQAIAEFDRALQIHSNFAEAYYQRGKSRHQLNDKPGAIVDFQIAAKMFCENNLDEELASWTPFELGVSNREEAIDYLIEYLSSKRSYEEKRLAASAISKLAQNFRKSCELTIPYLLANLSDPAPQLRQYVLKALSATNLPDDAIPKIRAIAQNDPKEYNRDIAENILRKSI